MVRYRFSHSLQDRYRENFPLFIPDYDSTWLEYDPKNPQANCTERRWKDVWQSEEHRDFFHRVHSKHIARFPTVEYTGLANYSTLAIIFCLAIIACVVIPQIFNILSILVAPTARHAPTPTAAPKIPENRKRLRLFYFQLERKKVSLVRTQI